jgi:hypothetical protein
MSLSYEVPLNSSTDSPYSHIHPLAATDLSRIWGLLKPEDAFSGTVGTFNLGTVPHIVVELAFGFPMILKK